MQHRLKIQNTRRGLILPAIRAAGSLLLWCFLVYLSFHYRTCTYLVRQGMGQFTILVEARPPDGSVSLSERARKNLAIVADLKRYTVDSLGFDPTKNYDRIYHHGSQPVLWVVTASKPYSLEPVQWTFPVVGKVSYKGFFDKQLAAMEFDALRKRGLDAEVSPVTAYSTLGWFADPLFSGMLERNRGSFCNLIFHELFHATYYLPGNVNLNENLASFIAHKATLRFLASDSAELAVYLRAHVDYQIIRRYMKNKALLLEALYEEHAMAEDLPGRKRELLRNIADSLLRLPLDDKRKAQYRARQILAARNAYFVGYLQYESLQDSLEIAFNNIYRRNIKNMVHDLKRR